MGRFRYGIGLRHVYYDFNMRIIVTKTANMLDKKLVKSENWSPAVLKCCIVLNVTFNTLCSFVFLCNYL